MRRLFLIVFLFVAVCATAPSAQSQGFTFADMMRVKRVADPQLSPEGNLVAFTVGTVDMTANRVVNQIYIADVRKTEDVPVRITDEQGSSSSPRWSPDGRLIAFVYNGQIWTMNANGNSRKQVTNISTGAGNPVWSPDGKWIAFVSDVYPDCQNDECNKSRDQKAESSKVKAIVTERLLYRHWVEWRDKKRTHVFVVQSDGGTASDMTPGDFDSPPYAASSGVDYAFSSDSSELAFLKNPDPIEAVSTNSDIIVRSLSTNAEQDITSSNHGYDASPQFTSDGRYIIYRSQATAGFESDRWRLMRYDRKAHSSVELTQGFDQQVSEYTFSPDGKTIYFTAGLAGRSRVFSVPVEPNFRLRIATHVKEITGLSTTVGSISSISLSSKGDKITFLSSSMASPAEVYVSDLDGRNPTSLSRANPNLGLPAAEEVAWTGAVRTKIHGWVLKPRDFDPSRKYPLIVLIHGGPQGAWMDNWGYRWNPQIYANAGYVVFMPNPRGSTSYGQKFVNEISGDWGGKAFVDIKNGIADVIRRPYIDRSRIGAAGASYGGYMVDWLLGHNNDPRFKFKAFVSHAGVYNLESMAGATEELWFVMWEFKGMPWQNPVLYNRWSPHRFAAKFDTPTLVTAGEIDFRVPVDQDMQLFTALQLNKVPSKLIIFPDEGHWIQKPQNSEFWHQNVLDWFAKYLK